MTGELEASEHTTVGVILASILTASYASAVTSNQSSSSSSTKIRWAINPVTIGFSSTAGQSSIADYFTCRPSIGAVTLVTKTDSPAKIRLSTSPTRFTSCSSNPDTVTIKATCVTARPTACKGTYQGTVEIKQQGNYSNQDGNNNDENNTNVLRVKIIVS